MNKYLLSRAYEIFVGELDLKLWNKLYIQSDKCFLKKRLLAIKYLHEGKSQKEILILLNCSNRELLKWIDRYLMYGLEELIYPSDLGQQNRTDILSEIEVDWGFWQYLYDSCALDYQKKRLLAIQHLYEGISREKTCKLIGCTYKTLSGWIDKFISGGLEELIEPITHE